MKAENLEGKCCPFYTCEPPKDKCIFESEYAAAPTGGEKLLTNLERQKVLKGANETWKDGPCRNCKCVLTSLGKLKNIKLFSDEKKILDGIHIFE